MQTEEQILAEGCQKGENTARKELYDRFAGRLLAICMRYVALRAWIERITVNVALEWLRNRNRLGTLELDEGRAAAEIAEPEPGEVARIPQEVLMRFVAELPDGYRTVFNLYCIEERSHKEIAELLGINEKSSSSQLFRARTLLARRIKDYLKSQR